MQALKQWWVSLKRWFSYQRYLFWLYQTEKTLLKEHAVLCNYFGLSPRRTLTWEIYNWPYNPLAKEPDGWERLETILRIQNTSARRWALYSFMMQYGDITRRARRDLEHSESSCEFHEWLGDPFK